MKALWIPTVLNMFQDVPYWYPIIKDLVMDVSFWLGAQGSAIPAFNPFAAQRCVLHRQGFSSSVCQAVVRVTWVSPMKVSQQCWNEWTGWCTWKGVSHHAISTPKLAIFFWYIYLWLDKLGAPLAFIVQLFQLSWEPHLHHHKASNHPMISTLMQYFLFAASPFTFGRSIGYWTVIILVRELGPCLFLY